MKLATVGKDFWVLWEVTVSWGGSIWASNCDWLRNSKRNLVTHCLWFRHAIWGSLNWKGPTERLNRNWITGHYRIVENFLVGENNPHIFGSGSLEDGRWTLPFALNCLNFLSMIFLPFYLTPSTTLISLYSIFNLFIQSYPLILIVSKYLSSSIFISLFY